jgi:hypothetical protein
MWRSRLEDPRVANDLTREEMRRFARLGALRRLEEIRQEEAAIRAAFPDLDEGARGARRGRRRGRPPGSASTSADEGGTRRRRRRRRKMSAAERRAVSERMRRYWAERRKGR